MGLGLSTTSTIFFAMFHLHFLIHIILYTPKYFNSASSSKVSKPEAQVNYEASNDFGSAFTMNDERSKVSEVPRVK